MSRLSSSVLVADTDSLGRLVRALALEPIVAVDTESNSLHAYREQVCLIQWKSAHDLNVQKRGPITMTGPRSSARSRTTVSSSPPSVHPC